MDVIRRANYLEQLLKTGLPYKGGRARLDATSILTDIMAWPKLGWAAAMERMADEAYPASRALAETCWGDCWLHGCEISIALHLVLRDTKLIPSFRTGWLDSRSRSPVEKLN